MTSKYVKKKNNSGLKFSFLFFVNCVTGECLHVSSWNKNMLKLKYNPLVSVTPVHSKRVVMLLLVPCYLSHLLCLKWVRFHNVVLCVLSYFGISRLTKTEAIA